MTTDSQPPPVRTRGKLLRDHIADVLRARIARGDLQPGDRLPPVRLLAQTHRASEKTVTQAIALLQQERLVTGGRGRPAEVAAPPDRQAINLSTTWAQEQKDLVLQPREVRAERGAIEMTSGLSIDDTHSTHVYDKLQADAELADLFGIRQGAPLVRRRYEMRRRDNGIRVAYSTSYIPRDLIKGYRPLLDDRREPWPGGHQHQLYCVGIEVDAFERTVIAVPPTPEQQDMWAMTASTPMMLVRSLTIDTTGRVVEMSDAEYPGDRWKLTTREQLTRWPADHPRFDQSKGDA